MKYRKIIITRADNGFLITAEKFAESDKIQIAFELADAVNLVAALMRAKDEAKPEETPCP